MRFNRWFCIEVNMSKQFKAIKGLVDKYWWEDGMPKPELHEDKKFGVYFEVKNDKGQTRKVDPIAYMIEKEQSTSDDYLLRDAVNLNLKINKQDPILYAIEHNHTIQSEDPVLWAVMNNKKIDGIDPFEWCFDQENIRHIAGYHPIVYAILNGKQIEGKSVFDWVIENPDDRIPALYAGYLVLQGATRDSVLKVMHEKGVIAKIDAYQATLSEPNPILDFIKEDIFPRKQPVTSYEGSDVEILTDVETNLTLSELIDIAKNPQAELVEGHDPGLLAFHKGASLFELIKNGAKIEGDDAIVYAIKNRMFIRMEDGSRLHPLLFAIKQNLNIEGLSPIDWAAQHEMIELAKLIVLSTDLTPEERNALIPGIVHRNDILIQGITPLQYALKNNIEINGKHPAEYALSQKKYQLLYDLKPTAELGYVILDAYNNAKTPKEKSEIEALHNIISKKVIGVDQLDKSLSKLLGDTNINTAARKIEKLGKSGELNMNLDADKMVWKVNIQTLSHMCKIGEKLEHRETHGMGAKDFLNKLSNFIKEILSLSLAGVKDKDIIKAIGKLPAAEETEKVSNAKEHESTKKLEKFASKAKGQSDHGRSY